jgi:hypothetical protein
MRPVVLILCGLLAAPSAGWAQTASPADAAVRCAVATERAPRMMELGVALARAAARDYPALRSSLPNLEKSFEDARPAMGRTAAQARAQALASFGGDAARLDREMELVRRTHAPLETLTAEDPKGLAAAAERLQVDMQQCQPATNSTAPGNPR